MNQTATPHARSVAGFRTRLLVAMMLVISGITALALYLAERNLSANIERDLQRDFEGQLAGLHQAEKVRHAALVERCRALVRRPRIHASLEDNALDLLYPSAEDELRDIMAARSTGLSDDDAVILRARFYRFLDRTGRVIGAPRDAPIGAVPPEIEVQLNLPGLSDAPQLGFVALTTDGRRETVEVIAMPIISTETSEPIAALVLGFVLPQSAATEQLHNGVWVNGAVDIPGLSPAAAQQVAQEIAARGAEEEGRRRLDLDGRSQMLFFKRLNPGAAYPPAFEISVSSLDQFSERRTQLRLQILGLGALLLIGGYFASHLMAVRLSAPVEKLAIDSERSARFSADASHQLKTPVTVLRAGLEELLSRENLTPEDCDAIAALIHQTYRLSGLIEDLLLLSRMDSGRLRLALRPVDLGHLIAAAVDDLSAAPAELALDVQTEVPPVLSVAGEPRYTGIILQNLLENARKYNRPGGTIRISARVEGDAVHLSVANTGKPIAPAAQAHIFERFHRGSVGENVPGYGLGLNLARELARLHGGELRLVRSDELWTEFEVRFCAAPAALAV